MPNLDKVDYVIPLQLIKAERFYKGSLMHVV
jgi:hypothetical protein